MVAQKAQLALLLHGVINSVSEPAKAQDQESNAGNKPQWYLPVMAADPQLEETQQCWPFWTFKYRTT